VAYLSLDQAHPMPWCCHHRQVADRKRQGPRWRDRVPWLQDPRLRRRALLYFYGAVLLGIAVATIAAVVAVTQVAHLTFSDRLAEVGVFIGGGTLALAAAAGLVAVQAYAFAAGLPDLRIQITFAGCLPNQPVLRAEMAQGWIKVLGDQQPFGRIALENLSSYSARNPAVVVTMREMKIARNEYSPVNGWVIIEAADTTDVTTLQWDGGSDYSIHGDLKRHLPAIFFGGLACLPSAQEPAFVVDLLAEGYRRKEISIPVDLVVNDQSKFPRAGSPAADWI
jgi:hypothetical protein